jgi:P pilus assembly protein, pilin FimA
LKLITTKIIYTLFAVISSFAQAASDKSEVSVTGRILANTCIIDSASAKQTINLPDIADRDIAGKGTIVGTTDVLIVLNDCGASATGVLVNASGNPDTEDITAFANSISQADGGATGVGVYFFQTDGLTKFLPDGSVTQTSKLTPLMNNTLTYKAAYVGTKNKVTPGILNTIVNMTFDYL